ncbi:MAG TPA: flagellar protein export ATPase FliI [Candidatus Macondimonas sp.]|nr:flagellar protein export ATPase FliI [Candidatus Macondimonas sp.]
MAAEPGEIGLAEARAAHWQARLVGAQARAQDFVFRPRVAGRLRRVVGLTLEASGCRAAVGERCLVETRDGGRLEAEVVGFAGERLYLMPTHPIQGLAPDARVFPSNTHWQVGTGEGLLGRVLDGAGEPIDGLGPLQCSGTRPLYGAPLNPLERGLVRQPLDVGVRTLNALLTIGRGQRLGLFAGSGVGKSVLLGMMTRYTEADVTVVALIGERGREVREFVEQILGRDGLQRAVVVATPADHPPLMRLQGAWVATAIAESFRDQGRNVLLLMDSLTRVAQAQREIALAIGEPPATKGYPPSVFAQIPRLVERAGNTSGQGSLTAFYTVLAEGDDQNDPVVDAARAILDGHIVLSRRLAEAGQFPAIDVEASVSRVLTDIAGPEHLRWIRRFRQIYATYAQHADLIRVGAYQRGSDAAIDEAIALWPRLQAFLRQDLREAVSFSDSLSALAAVLPAEVVTAGMGTATEVGRA